METKEIIRKLMDFRNGVHGKLFIEAAQQLEFLEKENAKMKAILFPPKDPCYLCREGAPHQECVNR